jgi:hypothetical protein
VSQAGDANWKNLCKIGGVAALMAVIVFRRNFGTAGFPPLYPLRFG